MSVHVGGSSLKFFLKCVCALIRDWLMWCESYASLKIKASQRLPSLSSCREVKGWNRHKTALCCVTKLIIK